jgi:hypothetical protein
MDMALSFDLFRPMISILPLICYCARLAISAPFSQLALQR